MLDVLYDLLEFLRSKREEAERELEYFQSLERRLEETIQTLKEILVGDRSVES